LGGLLTMAAHKASEQLVVAGSHQASGVPRVFFHV
jgi:hypothetical protein